MAKSIDDAFQSMWQNLAEKTGKDRSAWIALSRASGHSKHRELVNWLKSEHGLTHGYANAIALASLAKDEETPAAASDQIDGLFEGGKAGLRPIYDQLIQVINGFGDDVELAPKKAYVSLRRSKQFGIIQPTTATRLDLGLVLKGVIPTERLEASGSFNAMLTHRVRLSATGDVDSELAGWLKKAYSEA
jgi:hypothetical protein